MKTLAGYALAGLAVVVVTGVAGGMVSGDDGARGVRVGALVAYAVQLVAFGVLLRLRRTTQGFMAGWVAGMLMRIGVVGVAALWLTRTRALPPEPTLISLVAVVFVLLMLEPLFLKRGGSTA